MKRLKVTQQKVARENKGPGEPQRARGVRKISPGASGGAGDLALQFSTNARKKEQDERSCSNLSLKNSGTLPMTLAFVTWVYKSGEKTSIYCVSFL